MTIRICWRGDPAGLSGGEANYAQIAYFSSADVPLQSNRTMALAFSWCGDHRRPTHAQPIHSRFARPAIRRPGVAQDAGKQAPKIDGKSLADLISSGKRTRRCIQSPAKREKPSPAATRQAGTGKYFRMASLSQAHRQMLRRTLHANKDWFSPRRSGLGKSSEPSPEGGLYLLSRSRARVCPPRRRKPQAKGIGVHTNTAEGFFSIFKRGMTGVPRTRSSLVLSPASPGRAAI